MENACDLQTEPKKEQKRINNTDENISSNHAKHDQRYLEWTLKQHVDFWHLTKDGSMS